MNHKTFTQPAATPQQPAGSPDERTNPQTGLGGFGARFGFGFVSAYLLLYIFPFPFSLLGFAGSIFDLYSGFWEWLASWVGSNVLHLRDPLTRFSSGQGDTAYDFVRLLCIAVIAMLAAWSLSFFTRSRIREARIHAWMRAYLRLALSCAMIGYGANKVIPVQFSFNLPLDRLLQPIGDASPMGLLWTFMGASSSYTIFTGIAEVVAGMLLLSRRTTPGGSLLCIGVLGNVVMLNFSYDVPVKLYSSHLLATAFFLAAPDINRFARVMLFNRPTSSAQHWPLFEGKWSNRCLLIAKPVFVLFIATPMFVEAYSSLSRARSPLHGVWLVEEFAVDGSVKPPVAADEIRWQRVIFDQPWIFAIQFMNGSRERFYLNLDTTTATLSLRRMDNSAAKSQLSFVRTEPGTLKLHGELDGQTIDAKLRVTQEPRFRLTSRGFHWVSESHFNR